jgi:ABC-2 type transport system permease protein
VTSARIFFLGGIASYRALFGWLSPWVFIPSLLVAPVFQILLFVYIGRSAQLESDEFYVVGNAIQYAAIPCLFAMTHLIAGERFQQTLGYILITPAKRLPLFVGRSLPVVANGFFVAAFALLVGGRIVDIEVPASAYGPIALATMVSAFSCTGLGLVTAGLGLIVRETGVLCNIIFGVLLIFSGANIPIDQLPGWMQAISEVMPFTHGIEAVRQLVDGASLEDVSGLIGQEALIGLVYGALGYALIRVMEVVGRKHATFDRS